MTKQLNVIDENLMEEFLSIFSIGLLECVKKGIIDVSRAEQWLFSPVIAYSSKLKSYSKPFVNALNFASENYATIKFENFEKSIDKNLELFFEIIGKISKKDYQGKLFIDGII